MIQIKRALKISFIVIQAYHKIFMRGELSRVNKSFQIDLRLANWSYFLYDSNFLS